MSINFLAYFINIKEYLILNSMSNLKKNISFGLENSRDTYCSLLFDSEIEINRIQISRDYPVKHQRIAASGRRKLRKKLQVAAASCEKLQVVAASAASGRCKWPAATGSCKCPNIGGSVQTRSLQVDLLQVPIHRSILFQISNILIF